MPSYSSSQAVLAGPAQTFSPTSFVYGYVEVHNLGGAPMFVTFNGAAYPLPASGRLAFNTQPSNGTTASNSVSVSGVGTVYVFFASEAPPVPVLTQNALGGGGGGVYTADGVTLQEIVANQFSIKNLGVSTAQLNNDAVTAPKIAVNALEGFHVGGAINVATPTAQMIIWSWAAGAVADDTFELTVTYGLAGTTVVQEFILDPTGPLLPGQIGVTITGNPAQDCAAAITAWGATLPVPRRLSAYAPTADFCAIVLHDIDAISCTSSGLQWSGATPTNSTVELQPVGNQLPTPQPMVVYRRTVTAAEAAATVVMCAPSTQEDLMYGLPAIPLVQVWRQTFPNVYSDAGFIPTIALNASPTGFMTYLAGAFNAGDVVVCMFGSSANGRPTPAITPNPYP